MNSIYIYVVGAMIGAALSVVSFILGRMWEQRIWLESVNMYRDQIRELNRKREMKNEQNQCS